MAELKTKENEASVETFLETIEESKREDTKAIIKMMSDATGDKPKMWGAAIIGFGKDRLTYASGKELDWFRVGISPRKANLSLYGLRTALDKTPGALEKIGKFTGGTGCIYIKRLADVNKTILEEVIKNAATTLAFHTNYA